MSDRPRGQWIKLATDLFDDEKIRLIEAMPNADALLIIWVKLLCRAGRMNNGGIFAIEGMPLTDEMLATLFNRPRAQVKTALRVFENLGMLVRLEEGAVAIPEWDSFQSLDRMENRREYMRRYQQLRRESERAAEAGVNNGKLDVNTPEKKTEENKTKQNTRYSGRRFYYATPEEREACYRESAIQFAKENGLLPAEPVTGQTP